MKKHKEKYLKCKLFNSFFYELLTHGGEEYKYERVKAWTKNVCIVEIVVLLIGKHFRHGEVDFSFTSRQSLDPSSC